MTSIVYDRLAGTSTPNARFYQLQMRSNSLPGGFLFAGPRPIPGRDSCDRTNFCPHPLQLPIAHPSPRVWLAWRRATLSRSFTDWEKTSNNLRVGMPGFGIVPVQLV
ncbi:MULTISPECIES: hypothetical protein [unclassified Microcoleus]|uniref:hypothetical protein n=1 Tax=unclassified Microcoleus TaxID=2642155 RepID=UPI002FD49FFE